MINEAKILVQDDDCHWYLIPLNKKEEWDKEIEDRNDSPYISLHIIPDWAEEVDSPESIAIYTYRETNNFDKPQLIQEPDLTPLKNLTEQILKELKEDGYTKDPEHWVYEVVFTTLYGKGIFEYMRTLER